MTIGRKLTLDRANGKLFGVCAGIAARTGWDPTLVRVALVVATLAGGFPWTLIAYFAFAFFARESGGEGDRAARVSSRKVSGAMTDLDRRMAAVDSYVTTSNSSLAREIESLR